MIDPKATAERMELLLGAMQKKGMQKKGCRWDVHLHQAVLSALRKLLPLTDDNGQVLATRRFHNNPKVLAEIEPKFPEVSCRRTYETIRNFLYAGAFVDAAGEVIKNVRTPVAAINDNSADIQAGLILQALRHARDVEGGIQPTDARPLALIIFGKGRPDFMPLVQKIAAAITDLPALKNEDSE